MMFRLLFGMVMSSGLAWGALSLFGFFRGAVTPFGFGAGVILTGIYFAAFRSGLAGRTRAKAIKEQEPSAWKKFEAEEKEILQPAA